MRFQVHLAWKASIDVNAIDAILDVLLRYQLIRESDVPPIEGLPPALTVTPLGRQFLQLVDQKATAQILRASGSAGPAG